MGYRNHLHVCQACGIVHASASPTAPTECVVCDAFTFSEYELNGLLEERHESEEVEGDLESSERDKERIVTRVSER